MTIEEYRKQLDELLAKGLTLDEADAIIDGGATIEEALKSHLNEAIEDETEYQDVQMETEEDARKVMDAIRKVRL